MITFLTLQSSTLESKETGISGAAICPVDPDDNATAVWAGKICQIVSEIKTFLVYKSQ